MAIVTRNILYRKPVDFASQLPVELVFHILSFLPARDLKTVRLVNRLLADIGRKNVLWSELCREKWSEKLCLQTLPMPSPHIPEATSDDTLDRLVPPAEDIDLDRSLESHLLSMRKFENHTDDELRPYSLHDLAYYFPAFHCVEGSWMLAYNLVNQHMQISYLCARVREDPYAVSDTQWEFRFSRTARSSESHSMIHAFVDYRRDYKLYIVKGHQYWQQPFVWRPLPNGMAIQVQEFPPHDLGRNSDGYRMMTNKRVYMTSSSEYSFIRDLGRLSEKMMLAQTGPSVLDGDIARISQLGEALLKWINAYSRSPGDKRACWVGAKKKVVCITWRDVDSSDEDDDDDDDFIEEEDDEE